jgi:chemotaxis protein methyltransferase CheR
MSNGPSVFAPDAPIRPLQHEEFGRFRSLLYDRFGIDLREGKEELVSARLSKKIRELGFTSFSQYFEYVTSGRESEAMPEMVDLLTTNHTAFFRESVHFDFMRRVLAELKPRKTAMRIWSAACSSGEEPYSIAMTALEHLAPSTFEIVGTDLSNRALKAAASGIYAEERVREIPSDVLRKHFLRGEGKATGYYRVKPVVSGHVKFHRLNLVDSYSHPAPFSMIWCRNVMIYFDKPTQERVVKRLSEWLEPGGYLFIGHSEALNGVRHSLRYIQPAVYRKP